MNWFGNDDWKTPAGLQFGNPAGQGMGVAGGMFGGTGVPTGAAGAALTQTPQINIPGQTGVGMGGIFGGIGANVDTAKLALGGLATVGQLYGAYQAQKLAKAQFDYTRQVTDRNLANQTQSYNTALDDRIESRAATQGNMSAADVAAYKAKNRMV
jgi:hypothetical protein